MFHTFEGFENPTAATPARGGRERQPSIGRRVTTLRACTSCRHRKIKCDGEKPCEACRWYKKADLCHYSDPRPSRRHVEKLSTTLDEYRTVLEKLFPGATPETLASLPREKLLELTSKALVQPQSLPQVQVQSAGPRAPSPATSATASHDAHVSPISNEDGNLESLQAMPEESTDPRILSSEIANTISDDVNALSLSSRGPSSYLGVSSVNAVLKTIVWLDPGSVSYFASTPPSGPRRGSMPDLTSSEGQSWPGHDQPGTPPQVHMQVPESQLLDAYFTYVQPLTPILDEQSFRETYASGHRKDDRWYCLLNMVLAMGSICASTCDDISHKIYYSRCRAYLDLESLGSSHLETVQTLGILGGWYLHYVAQPNLAYALMGAALRMAATMGLHKEFADQSDTTNKHKMASLDLKRRVWWTLFLMDCWGGVTLGRPTMGRFSPSITVKLPHHRESGNVLDILPLLENVRFCKISNQIQDALAVSPLTKYSEILHFDNQLVEWYNSLPYILKDHEPCPESIANTREVMKWRYHVQRILLYRPTLLSYAMRRVPYIALRSEERTAIERCREIAETAISDISAAAKTPQMNGWNAVWFLFQSTMVPLLGLFINDHSVTDPRASTESCQTQVQEALLVFARLQLASPTARKTLDAVSRIFEASKRGPSMIADTNSINSLNLSPTSREASLLNMAPGVLPSQNDFGRSFMVTHESGFTDPFPPSTMDDPSGQYLWDFLSWSDTNLVPMADMESINDASLLGADDKHLKYASNGFFGNQLTEPPFFSNPSIPYYS
ncbi:fungal-specific transcription factor domain-containing protein [Aspergillus crustosus]